MWCKVYEECVWRILHLKTNDFGELQKEDAIPAKMLKKLKVYE